MLLVLLLGLADFGRVFTAGISVEAAARNAAEVGAQQRLRTGGVTRDATYYEQLHEVIAKTVCRELRNLPNTTFQSSDSTCPTMPLIRVCIQDDQDPLCGMPINGFSSASGNCSSIPSGGWSNASGGSTDSYAVQVRVCYQFTTLMDLHIALPMNTGINVGDVWLEKQRTFAIDCPPSPPALITTC